MKSKIINMAEKMKDAEDLKLEALFQSDGIPDDGFSVRIEKQIRRKVWVRRLTLPIAALIGGSIAIKPLSGLVAALLNFASVLPLEKAAALNNVAISGLPSPALLLMGSVLVIVALFAGRFIED